MDVQTGNEGMGSCIVRPQSLRETEGEQWYPSGFILISRQGDARPGAFLSMSGVRHRTDIHGPAWLIRSQRADNVKVDALNARCKQDIVITQNMNHGLRTYVLKKQVLAQC